MKSANMMYTRSKATGIAFAIIAFSTILLVSLLFPASSLAADISGDSRTYALSRKTVGNENILGIYEYLDIAVQDLGNESISFHTGGWLRYDLRGEGLSRKTNSDLQYSYLSFKSKTDNAVVNLGRVMVFEGVAAERVDGLYARTDLKADFAISGFAGVPVETNIDTPGNNSIYGARLSHQLPGLYRIGLSYLREEKNSDDFREEGGVDVWVHPVDKVDIAGRSNYNALTKGWMENTYNLVLGPFDKLRLTTEASWISYKDYFIGATTSAFSFQPGILDPDEKVRRTGEEAAYALTEKIGIAVDYRAYDYEVSGSAQSYGGNIRYSIAASGGAGFSYHRMDGDAERFRYAEYRVYGYKKIDKINLAIDLLDVKYDTVIHGVSNAYSASIAAQYDLTQRLKLGADLEYAKNPDFDKEVRAFVKAIYRFNIATGGRKGA